MFDEFGSGQNRTQHRTQHGTAQHQLRRWMNRALGRFATFTFQIMEIVLKVLMVMVKIGNTSNRLGACQLRNVQLRTIQSWKKEVANIEWIKTAIIFLFLFLRELALFAYKSL